MDRPIYDHTIHQHAVLSKHRKCRFHFVLQKRILRRIQPRPFTEKLFCLWYPDFYAHLMFDKIRVTKRFWIIKKWMKNYNHRIQFSKNCNVLFCTSHCGWFAKGYCHKSCHLFILNFWYAPCCNDVLHKHIIAKCCY